MSLTRDEWLEMWQHVKSIEDYIKDTYPITNAIRENIKYDLEEIKGKIQKVIGQME